jgi:hypothetical protein
MKQEDIIRMACEAGLPNAWISESGVLKWSDLEAFAALVAANEREACAKLAEMAEPYQTADLIRARGQA